MDDEQKINHVNRCEFHNGRKEGVCPTVSEEFAKSLTNEERRNNGKTRKTF